MPLRAEIFFFWVFQFQNENRCLQKRFLSFLISTWKYFFESSFYKIKTEICFDYWTYRQKFEINRFFWVFILQIKTELKLFWLLNVSSKKKQPSKYILSLLNIHDGHKFVLSIGTKVGVCVCVWIIVYVWFCLLRLIIWKVWG